MMRVRVLTGMSGYPAGTVVEVEDARAVTWLGQGIAEAVRHEEHIEQETAEPQGETAVRVSRRGRRG